MDQPTWIGRSLNGRYKISALLGKGGMSAVYKAHDPNLKRVVAIKLIHSHLSTDPNFIHRFKKEAAAVAAFRHPNIVQVYDFSADGDVYYMVLEFIPGETLQERLKGLKRTSSRMPVEQAVQIVIDICDAMGYAHRNGMIHRDIKPANIMLDTQGRAILMDFGIVKIVDDETYTATGAVVGTARYMSPEVIRSETPDERSDIYSLGVTFFEMLSGSPPFNAESAMSLLMRHLNDPVPDLRPEVPDAVVVVIHKSLEKDRGKRYRSADEMAGHLRRILAALEANRVSSAVPVPIPDLPADEPATEVVAPPLQDDATEAMTTVETALTQSDADIDPATLVEEDATVSFMDLMLPEAQEPVVPSTTAPLAMPPLKEETRTGRQTSLSPMLLFGGGGILLLVLLLAGWYLFNSGLAASRVPTATETRTPTPTSIATEPAALLVNTDVPTATSTPTIPPTATHTLPPLYVRINNITVDNERYIVEYETFGYTEIMPGQHVHFFFNTVPPEQAGSPANSPWFVYGGPRPFDGYRLSDRPAAATQMCALVANPNHSIILESGNCFDLP